MSASFGTGFHATPTGTVDASAYERFTGRWSRLFIPSVLADIAPGSCVLDVSTGTGEAASMALSACQVSSLARISRRKCC
jgi:ribosomal protein L11 methylase PrmA